MISIWYEILPVTLDADQVVTLRRCEDGEIQTWQISHQAGRHPNDAVLEQVERFFGDLFEPDLSIVHSTSWRYCQRSERIILTYLVVLPQRVWRSFGAVCNCLVAQPVGKVEQVHGDNLHPPVRIELNNVLSHALDHLALLNSYDERINAALETGWSEILETRLRRPAGYLDRVPPTFSGKQARRSAGGYRR